MRIVKVDVAQCQCPATLQIAHGQRTSDTGDWTEQIAQWQRRVAARSASAQWQHIAQWVGNDDPSASAKFCEIAQGAFWVSNIEKIRWRLANAGYNWNFFHLRLLKWRSMVRRSRPNETKSLSERFRYPGEIKENQMIVFGAQKSMQTLRFFPLALAS